MTRKPTPPDAFSPEESRYLDGEATPDDARRLERQLAADPARAERIDAWREAMDVWREDAARVPVDPDALADRILAAPSATGLPEPPRVQGTPPFARWYAAAAVLLICLGLTGTLLTNPRKAVPLTANHPPQPFDKDIEHAIVDLILDSPELPPPSASPEEGR